MVTVLFNHIIFCSINKTIKCRIYFGFQWFRLFLWHKCKKERDGKHSTQQTKVLFRWDFFRLLLFILGESLLSLFLSLSIGFWSRSKMNVIQIMFVFFTHSTFHESDFLTRMWSGTGKLFDATHFKQQILLMGTIFFRSVLNFVGCVSSTAHHRSPNWFGNEFKTEN